MLKYQLFILTNKKVPKKYEREQVSISKQPALFIDPIFSEDFDTTIVLDDTALAEHFFFCSQNLGT